MEHGFGGMESALTLLAETEPPLLRAQLLERASRHMSSAAAHAVRAYGERDGRELEREMRAMAWFLAALASAETARATGRPRELSRWDALEETVGALLDQLGDPTLVDHESISDVYGVVFVAAGPRLGRDAGEDVLSYVRRVYEQRRDGGE